MRTQKKNFRKIEDEVSEILKPAFKKRRGNFLLIDNLAKNWEKITDSKLAPFSKPKKIGFEKGQKSNGTLTISVSNSTIGFCIESRINEIIENIACYFGYKIISKIIIKQDIILGENLTEKNPDSEIKLSTIQSEFINQNISQIKNEDLRLTLEKLGKTIFIKNEK